MIMLYYLTINLIDTDIFRGYLSDPKSILRIIEPIESSDIYSSRASDSQKEISSIYAYTSVLFLICYATLIYGGNILKSCFSCLCSKIGTEGNSDEKMQNIDFTNVSEIFAYIPQIRVKGINQPLLLCDIDQLDEKNYIGYDLPKNDSYDNHNVMFDIFYEERSRERNQLSEDSGQGTNNKQKPYFAVVKHWPPSWTFSIDEK